MKFTWHETMKQIEIMQTSLGYAFVRAVYPLTWPEIGAYCNRQLRADPLHRYDTYADFLVPRFAAIEAAGYPDLLSLVLPLTTQESVRAVADASGMDMEEFFGVLYYLTYWMLPRNFTMRDLISKGDRQAGEYCTILRKCGYANSLDLLDQGHTRDGRDILSARTGIPEPALRELVHRADLTRVGCGPNMVNNYFHSGFDTLEKIAQSDLDDLVERVSLYLATLGKVPKYGIDLPGQRAMVQVALRVVED